MVVAAVDPVTDGWVVEGVGTVGFGVTVILGDVDDADADDADEVAFGASFPHPLQYGGGHGSIALAHAFGGTTSVLKIWVFWPLFVAFNRLVA